MVGKLEVTNVVTDSTTSPEGSRNRQSDFLETHRGGGGSILTTVSWITTTTRGTIAVNAATGEASGTGYPWLGFAHYEPPSVVFVVIESLDRSVTLGIGVHLDKTKSLAASHITVLDDLGALHGPKRGKPFLQVRRGHGIGQISNIQILSHGNLLVAKTFRPVDCFLGR
jgi:hypothetical protein